MDWLTWIHAVSGKLAIASIMLFAGFLIATLAGKLVRRVLAEAELNRILVKAGFTPASNTIAVVVEYLIYVITLITVLQQFGLARIVLWVLGVAVAVIVVVSFLLTIRDVLPNLVAGLFVRRRLKSFIGKKLSLGSVSGKLERIGVVASVVRDGDEHHVPHVYTLRRLKRLQEGSRY